MTFVFAGILTERLSGAVAVLAGLTGLLGGAAHYAAVVTDRSERGIERATGFGYFLGFAVGEHPTLLAARGGSAEPP